MDPSPAGWTVQARVPVMLVPLGSRSSSSPQAARRAAGQLAALSRISIDDVYPARGRPRQRGYVREDQRRYALTGAGEECVASLEAARRAGIEAYVSDPGADDRRQLESALGLDA